MTVNSGLDPNPPVQPTLPYGSSTVSSIKKGTNVFRPGATTTGYKPFTAAGAGPYGPMSGVSAIQVGLTFPALYDGTDEEVGKILAGVDDTGDGTPLSPAFRRSLKDTLLAAGFLSKSDYVPSAEFGYADYSAMRQFLQNANYLGGYNWRQALGVVTDQLASKGTGAGGTSTYTQYSISRPEEAELIVDAALNNFLGRGATKEEKANLSKALRKYEQETPTVTTTTRGAGGTVGTTTTGATAEGRQQAILGGFSQAQEREMSGVVNTQLGNLFTDLLRNA